MGAVALVLLFICALIGFLYLYLSWNFDFWKKRGVKGPKPKLIYGTVPCIVKQNRNLAFELQDLYEKYKKTGERFIGIYMTRNPYILVIDPSLAREVLVNNFKGFHDNEPSLWVNKDLEEFASRNPFMTSGSKWKTIRSEFVVGLSPSRIKQVHPIVLEICKKLVSYMKATIQKSGKKFEVKNLCYKYTIEVVADFVWGINADALNIDEPPNQILKMSRKMLDDSFMKIGFYYLSGLLPRFLAKLLTDRFYPEETDNFFSQVQKDAMEMRLRNKNDRSDFLNYLIQLQEKKNSSHLDLVGHSLTVLLDAFETTGSVIAHALFFLSNNQSAQQKLREEIMANVDENGFIDFDNLVELPYLDQCVNETIRIVTIIAVTSRRCTEETYLENRENHKVKIEPGMIVYVPTYAIHNDPDVYPQPKEFIPERFDNGRAKELNQKGQFFPFGDGPRICAGMRLGMLEAKTGIVEIIKNFNLKKSEHCAKTLDPTSFLLGLPGDLFVEFEPIEH